jgi:hypothetical protein
VGIEPEKQGEQLCKTWQPSNIEKNIKTHQWSKSVFFCDAHRGAINTMDLSNTFERI